MYVTLVGKSFRPQGLDGSLDEFRIWDIARNPNDIEANMDLSLDPNETGLKVYWSFDQSSSSQNILDISGNNNIGIVGMDLAPAQDDPYFYDPNGPMGRACQRDIPILAQAALEGPYNVNTGLMNDNLRVGGLIPLTEPYSALGYYLPDSGGETIDPSVLATTGPDAIVDWVLLELRNPDAPEIIDESGIGLIQRDGDIVGLDGVNPLVIKVKGPDYNVALRHRNHFGVMTNASVEFGLSGTSVEIDFTDNALITYGTAARKNVGGAMCLWAGNAVGDDILKYSGVNNDRDAILIGIGGSVPTNTVFAYSELDINLDGDVKYAGVNNDRDIILVNIGGSVPTATRAEQLP